MENINPKEVSLEVQLFGNNKNSLFQYNCNVDELDKVVAEIKKIRQDFADA